MDVKKPKMTRAKAKIKRLKQEAANCTLIVRLRPLCDNLQGDSPRDLLSGGEERSFSPFNLDSDNGTSAAPSPVINDITSEVVEQTIKQSVTQHLFGQEEHTESPVDETPIPSPRRRRQEKKKQQALQEASKLLQDNNNRNSAPDSASTTDVYPSSSIQDRIQHFSNSGQPLGSPSNNSSSSPEYSPSTKKKLHSSSKAFELFESPAIVIAPKDPQSKSSNSSLSSVLNGSKSSEGSDTSPVVKPKRKAPEAPARPYKNNKSPSIGSPSSGSPSNGSPNSGSPKLSLECGFESVSPVEDKVVPQVQDEDEVEPPRPAMALMTKILEGEVEFDHMIEGPLETMTDEESMEFSTRCEMAGLSKPEDVIDLAPWAFAETIYSTIGFANQVINRLKEVKLKKQQKKEWQEDEEEKEWTQSLLDPPVETTKKPAYVRSAKVCMICSAEVKKLDVHLRKKHGITDREQRYRELNRQKKSQLISQGIWPLQCPVPGCPAVIKDGRIDIHLTRSKRHMFKASDPAYKSYIEEGRKARMQEKPSTSGTMQPPSHHKYKPLTDREVFEKAELYFNSTSGCKKNSALYTHEMEAMVKKAGKVEHKTPKIRLLFSGQTETLTKVKKDLEGDNLKPNTIKKYLTAAIKFSKFLQSNPLLAKELRISQTNVMATKQHAKNLRQGLASVLLQSSVDTRREHEAQKPTPQDRELYMRLARKEMLELEEKILDGLALNLKEMLYFRNHLCISIVWGNASRSGELENATVKDYAKRTITDDCVAIQVSEHKTLTSHGPAYMVVDGLEKRWLDTYVSSVRPNSLESFLFLNSKGKQSDKISRDMTVHFQRVTGIAKNITATNTRHNTVTTVFVLQSKDDQSVAEAKSKSRYLTLVKSRDHSCEDPYLNRRCSFLF